MSHATLPRPKLTRLGKHKWRVEEDFVYESPDGEHIKIPRGFITDGASSPLRILITSMGGHYPTAAVVHDWLYTRLNHGRPDPAAKTRKAADRIFRKEMKRAGVKPLVRFGIWLGVRAFGGPGFRKLGVR